jgi:hypothetical protein
MSRGKTENLFFVNEFQLLKDRWSRTKDNETLAQIVELSPPGGDVAVGKAIADYLRVKRPDKKAINDAMWREIDRVWRWLTVDLGKSEKDAYASIKAIYFVEFDESRYDEKTIERQHRLSVVE